MRAVPPDGPGTGYDNAQSNRGRLEPSRERLYDSSLVLLGHYRQLKQITPLLKLPVAPERANFFWDKVSDLVNDEVVHVAFHIAPGIGFVLALI
jgi:hypothetical protein